MSQRSIPSIEQVRQRPAVASLEARYGRRAVLEALRAEADCVREALRQGASYPDVAEVIERNAAARMEWMAAFSLRPVINATGVIIHTNLGRAPLGAAAVARVAEIAAGYSNLEYDLDAGARGRRDVHAERLICRLTGAEAACVVNNNAAATLITLAALAAGREAIVSRGELVEIGGGFRVPDVMVQSGVVLREVGTTNRTRASDYAAAIGDRTAVILEVRTTLAEGADIVMFSGDKLLGGPQAGIIAGASGPIEQIRRHPLMRALRVDKMTYAALEATLLSYAVERTGEVPVARLIAATAGEIGARAAALAAALAGRPLTGVVIDGLSTIGGGSAPGATLSTRLLQLHHTMLSANALEARLRRLDPPIIARIENDAVVLDLRTVLPGEDTTLLRGLHGLDG